MSHESRPKAAHVDPGEEVENESSGRDRRAYDPERYAPVRESVWKRFPSHPMRTFAIAFPRGTMFGPEGPSVRLKSGREVEGSVIRGNKVREIRERVGVSDRTWRRHIAEYVAQYVAHRCSTGDICLFAHAMPAECPLCHAELVYDRIPSSHRRPRSDRDQDGRFAVGQELTAHPDSYGPNRGRNLAATAAETWPLSSTDEPHREHSFRGMEVDGSRPEPSEEATAPGASAVEELPRGRLQETAAGELEWISPFEDKSCSECGCWPHQGDHFAGCSRRTA